MRRHCHAKDHALRSDPFGNNRNCIPGIHEQKASRIRSRIRRRVTKFNKLNVKIHSPLFENKTDRNVDSYCGEKFMKDHIYEEQLIDDPDYLRLTSDFEKKRLIPEEISSFEKMNSDYKTLHQTYAQSFPALYEEAKKRICRTEYSVGGTAINRGYYSPSALDLVAAGMNRGRLLKRKPASGKFDYEYCFDENDQLFLVHTDQQEWEPNGISSVEFIIHQDSDTISLHYDLQNNHPLTRMTKTHSENGLLLRYEDALYALEEDMAEINAETYEYDDGKMKTFSWSRYVPALSILEQLRYVLSRDEEGYLSTYTVEDRNERRFEYNSGNDLESYEILVRRK